MEYTFLETEPFNCFIPIWRANSLSACIISIIASAFDKSILPFKKALFVNSPGCANLAPALITSCKIFLVTNTPPWQLISTVFSAVNELGAFINETITSSTITFPSITCP